MKSATSKCQAFGSTVKIKLWTTCQAQTTMQVNVLKDKSNFDVHGKSAKCNPLSRQKRGRIMALYLRFGMGDSHSSCF